MENPSAQFDFRNHELLAILGNEHLDQAYGRSCPPISFPSAGLSLNSKKITRDRFQNKRRPALGSDALVPATPGRCPWARTIGQPV